MPSTVRQGAKLRQYNYHDYNYGKSTQSITLFCMIVCGRGVFLLTLFVCSLSKPYVTRRILAFVEVT